MELRHLRYFLAVAECGHITRAAERLGIQQPPLSQQIRALESELGSALFHRHPKGVDLTDVGHELRAEAERLLADFHAMQQRIEAFARGERGHLRVGFTSSAAAHAFTPEVLRTCRKSHPDILLSVSENNAAEITEAVAAQRLHCGFLRVPVAQPDGLAFESLLQEESLLAIPVDHRLARNSAKPVMLDELDGEKLVLVRRPGAPGLYANLLALCARRNVHVEVAAEVERMMTNVNLVAAGVGLSIVPASIKGSHHQAVVYRSFDPSVNLWAPLTLVYRAHDCDGPLGTFIALAKKLAKRHESKSR
ncbi:LysR family transcriptional regulator (plasmid) [Diaphorobacter sp. HDW4B]|uniref:LysR family transcriptional regulator n=1 Tax=Diaphorobacter sp. HDW4B TaxID=2714925 RepID=UPI00140E835B|nr:LysR family transcriptional regulator [Diaphorobacter sp. HDW4B]QIL74308.1 LysR family transcriptional regulator [Diaphorobacter sp. HDW4B]